MNFRPVLWGLVALLIPSAAATGQPAVPPVMEQALPDHVPLGGQYFIQLTAEPTRVAAGDAKIVDVKLLERQIRLVGLKEGATDLVIWSKSEPSGRRHRLIVGPDVTALQSRMAAVPALQDVVATPTPQGTTLGGSVPDLEALQKAKSLAVSEAGDRTDNQLTVSGRRMVAVEIRFAAVSTSTLKALGLNFSKLGGGFQFASGVPGSITGFTATPGTDLQVSSGLPLSQAFNLLLAGPGSSYMGAISALGSASLAQVLAEPTLLVRSGDDASFLAGGEIPIPVAQSGQSNGAISIQYRKFGVQLQVHATVLGNDRIVLRVNPEVSELDYRNALTMQGFNIPAIEVRSTDTTIELGDGQSFVLAGLMYSTNSNLEEKVPGLGDLPIIGNFFKRAQHSTGQQELIIVATPRLVSAMPSGAVPKLPGEGNSYTPSSTEMLLNTRQLDTFVGQYGVAP